MEHTMEEDDVTVRVAVRIRPQIPREVIDMCQICTTVTPGEPQVLLGTDKVFTFDYVFDTEDDQFAVYNTCVAPLIDSSLEGYNATILAYGQTGSGKTYTMGSGFDVQVPDVQLGIIPRAIGHLFEGIDRRIENAKAVGSNPPEFKVMAQFMELYNEEVIDLFNPSYNKEKCYKIHEDPFGGIQVKGVTLKPVTSTKEALQCLRVGALSRTTASTQMNIQSSRSHAIFTLHIRQQRVLRSENSGSDEFETLTAKFHFVDLAGSERLKRTGATGDRAKEGISINCGLLALGNVISALGDKTKKALHIPYRDSKLTRLLQDSLGGNSQTVMIACISPSDSDFMETLNTLKYANRTRNIKNKLTINQDKSSRTIGQLRQQIAQLQLELIEYKQGKRVIGSDGTESVNDMFYENNMLQSELNNLRTRVKAMQETIDNLTQKNTNLLAEKAVGHWIGGLSTDDNHVTDMVHAYIKEIEELQAKLIEANNTCDQLRKQISRNHTAAIYNSLSSSMDISLGDNHSLLEEAKRDIQRQIQQRTRKESEMEQDVSYSSSEYDSDSEEKESQINLKDELFSLTNDIDMKQKLIDELELFQRRMQVMRQNYEDKLMQLQARIKNTQEERDKILLTYTGQAGQESGGGDKLKRVKDEYTRKLYDMQKELKRLQDAQKEHARLVRNQSNQENKLKAFKAELVEMKRAKVRLINKMKEESARHKESEAKRLREIAQLKKEGRKNANIIKVMETECRNKDQVLKRKQEEVLNLRRTQRNRLSARASGRVGKKQYTEKHAKQKWLKVEKSINNITISKSGIVHQEVRMENFLKKREALGKELETLHEHRKQMAERGQDTTQLDSFIDETRENISYVQDAISETQNNVIQIEETQDISEAADIKQIVDSVNDLNEAKYLMHKLFSMTLSQSHAVAQREAKLKECDTIMVELERENTLKAQLLEHVLQQPYLNKDLIISVSSNANDTSSTYSSRSGSPVLLQSPYATKNSANKATANNASVNFRSNSLETLNNNNNKSKIRRRTVRPDELLYGKTE